MATTPKKKPTTKKYAPRGKKKPSPEIDRVWSILLFGIGILIAALTYVKGQPIWTSMSNVLFGVFGWGTYLVAPIIIYIAVLVAMGKPFKIRLIQLAIAMVIFCGATVVFSKYQVFGTPNFEEQGIELWNMAVERKMGGAISMLLGWGVLALFGRPVATIFMVVLILVLFMLVTNITPVDIFIFIKRHIVNAKETAKSVAQDSIGKYEINLNPTEKRKRKKDSDAYDYEDAPELKDEKEEPDFSPVYTAPQPQFDTFSKRGTQAQKPQPKPNYDIDLPFTKSNSAPLPMDETAIANEANAPQEPELITDIIAHDRLSRACLEIANPGMKVPSPVDEIKNINVNLNGQNSAVSQNTAENSSSNTPCATGEKASSTDATGEMSEVDKLIKKAIETPKQPLAVDPNNQLVMKDTAKRSNYRLPGLDLLTKPAKTDDAGADIEMKKNAKILVNTLDSFGVKTKILDICRGTSVTRYELQPLAGVKISRITSLADDIALNLATAGVRIEAPIPGKPAVGIEVPNANREIVRIRSVFEAPAFENSDAKLPICLGKDISGIVQIADLTKMPHLLIAGTTGSGKSVCTNAIILSLLYRMTPEDLKIILIDPKVVEFTIYNGIPHLAMPVITEPRKAAGALGSAVAEMEKRYQMFAANNVRDIQGYNKAAAHSDELEKMPFIVIVIDEMADLMMTSGKEVEDYICRLAQKARAAGMHMVVATQRPSVDVVTGLIKANIPSRIALSLSSQVDSRTILDSGGAEKLLGNGDMLFLPVGANKPLRIQGAFVSDSERERVIDFAKAQGDSCYNEEMIENTERIATQTSSGKQDGQNADADEIQDEMLKPAIEACIEAGQASTSMLQRRLRLGYGRAGRIIDQMEAMGIIGPYEGAKPRQILITRQQWLEMSLTRDVIEETKNII